MSGTMGRDTLSNSTAAIASPLAIACSLIGALLMLRVPQLPAWPWAIAALVLGVLLCGGRNAARYAGMLLIGAAWLALRGGFAFDAQLPAEASGKDYAVVGRVTGLPRVEPQRTVFDFTVDRGQMPVDGLVRLAWYRPEARIEAGARLRVNVRLRRPRGTRNPGGFDYEAHALQRGLRAQGYLLAIPQPLVSDPRGALDRVRERFAQRISREVPDARSANLLRTLIVGDQGALAPVDWDTLRRTGTTHLVAISGFHIGIVAGIAALGMGGVWRAFPRLALRVPRRIAMSVAAIAAATGYGLLAGISLPVLRTLLMIATVALAGASRRNAGVTQSLALAAAVVLLIDPLGLLAAGFWLSFAGVAWLIFCLQGRTRVRPLWLDFTHAQGVMALALLPLSIWFFQQASLTGAWINLLAIPWISLVTVPLGLLALALDSLGVDGMLWTGVLDLAAGSAALFWRLLDASADWPGGQWYLPRPSLLTLLLALVGAILVLLPRGVGGRIAGVLLLLPLVAPRSQAPPVGSVALTLIDVGQGQATVLRTHRHTLVIDTGPKFDSGLDMGAAAVVPTLRALGVGALDALVISHGDMDHDGGTDSVLAAHAPLRLLRSSPPLNDSPHRNWVRCRSGQRWRWDGVDIEVLHPPRWFPDLGN
ncbi:MAG: DNA internalization-related competence protein ComEC/Rec2, partial [Lysobacterales bacterium]